MNRVVKEELMLLGIVALLVLAIASPLILHDWSPVCGYVVDKGYASAYTDTGFMYMPDGNGGFYMLPTTNYYSERWYVVVGKRTATVTHAQWDRIQIGDYFDERKP